MPNIFFVSDTHFGHTNICKFTNKDGSKLRPWTDPDQMNEDLISNWNSVVKPHDKVYHLGDVVINRKYLDLVMPRLNGNKRLIRGNHDIFKTREYLVHFDEIYGVRVLSDMILSHIPLERESITSRFGTNVHGHLHGNDIPHGAYFNVSVEQINFTPIDIDTLRVKIREKKEKYPV